MGNIQREREFCTLTRVKDNVIMMMTLSQETALSLSQKIFLLSHPFPGAFSSSVRSNLF